jgi:hypothetical protein
MAASFFSTEIFEFGSNTISLNFDSSGAAKLIEFKRGQFDPANHDFDGAIQGSVQ